MSLARGVVLVGLGEASTLLLLLLLLPCMKYTRQVIVGCGKYFGSWWWWLLMLSLCISSARPPFPLTSVSQWVTAC